MPDASAPTREPHGAHNIAPDVHGKNFYTIDRQFQDVLSLYLDPTLARQMKPHFERLGELAGNRLDDLAFTADKHPPVLHPRDRFGRDEDWIEYHPSYREMEKIAFEEFGMHAMSHRAGVLGLAEPAHPLIKYGITYLFVQAEFGLMCPISVSRHLELHHQALRLARAEEAPDGPAPLAGSEDHAEGHAVHDREGRRLGCGRGRDGGRADRCRAGRRRALEAPRPEMVLQPRRCRRRGAAGAAARCGAAVRRDSDCLRCRAASRTERATATGSCV